MLFEIHAERSADDKKIFFYDNETNTLKSVDDIVRSSLVRDYILAKLRFEDNT